MDPAALASVLTGLLRPFLRDLLVRDGSPGGANVGVTEPGREIAERIWRELSPRLKNRRAALDAAGALARTPQDDGAAATFLIHLRKALELDPELAAELSQIVASGEDTGSGEDQGSVDGAPRSWSSRVFGRRGRRADKGQRHVGDRLFGARPPGPVDKPGKPWQE
jgi:hypothetical protein